MTVSQRPIETDATRTAADALEACNRHDVDALARLVSEDVGFDNPVTGPTDRAGMLAFHRALFAGFPDIDYQATQLTTEGDRRRLSVGAAFVISVRGGLIASWRSYFDRVPVLRVLGRIE